MMRPFAALSCGDLNNLNAKYINRSGVASANRPTAPKKKAYAACPNQLSSFHQVVAAATNATIKSSNPMPSR